jgi:hypothetical protein
MSVAPSALGFGSVAVGSSKSQTVRIINTGSWPFTVSGAGSSGTGFSTKGLTFPFSLSPGTSAVLTVTFAPPSAGNDAGSVWVKASSRRRSRSRTATVALTGTGTATSAGQIVASPAALAFGSLLTGQSQTLNVTLNNGGSAAVTVSLASVSNGAFKVSGLSLPASLAAGHSLTFGVVFSPTVAGSVSSQLAISSTASNPTLAIALSGTGAANGQLTLAPSTLNFGSVVTGSSTALNGTLTAASSPVTVSSVSSTSTEFVVSGISLPLSLAAGTSVPYTVTFRPQASGIATASLSFASNAANRTLTESLTGTGAAAAQHKVSLQWNPSTSSGVVGYNLYRGTVSGGPYTEISSRAASPTYLDSTVSAGQTYYYVVTAVDGVGTESVHSNQATAVVPTP